MSDFAGSGGVGGVGGVGGEAPETAEECRVITDRIQKLEMARALAETGQVVRALELLRKLRTAYVEPDKRRLVEWLITDLEQKQR